MHTLEYTHTNKGLLLNCRRGNGQGEGGTGKPSAPLKNHTFFAEIIYSLRVMAFF